MRDEDGETDRASEGARREKRNALVGEDEDVALLVLAASEDPKAPGPLVTSIAG